LSEEHENIGILIRPNPSPAYRFLGVTTFSIYGIVAMAEKLAGMIQRAIFSNREFVP
jgi:hypothetical protein